MSKSKLPKTFQLPKGELHQLPLVHIIPSPTNPRKRFSEEQLQELATSIMSVGVMQPVVVHSNDAGGFDLISGERRWRAAQLAGLETIPAMVYPRLPDDIVFELQITENLQRADINPMEESDAFHELTRRGMTTADDIAKRLGKSTKYVYDRLALQKCILEVQDAIRNGELPIAAGKQFARLNMDDQASLWEAAEGSKELEPHAIRERIARQFSLQLANAPFNIQNPNLVPKAGSCTTCPKRSGCNQLLFDDVLNKDVCFDKACYDKKVEAHVQHKIDELQGAGYEVHRISNYYYAKEGALYPDDYTVLQEGDPLYEECKVVGVIVEPASWKQEKIGDVLKIKLNEQNDEDEDEDQDDDETNRETPEPRKGSSIDHEEAAIFRAVDQLAAIHNANTAGIPGIFSLEVTARLFKDFFYKITNTTAERLCDAMGWEKVLDGDGDFDQQKTSEMLAETLPLSLNLVWLAICVDTAENAVINRYDEEDYQRYVDELKPTGFDINALIEQYEAETGHSFK